MRDEIAPKNIMLIGPTGVGKTEIARRLAQLAGAPFIKVEASKFTEVGYVGRDVDSMVRDLAETAVSMLREEERERVRPRARENAEERLLDVLLPPDAARTRPAGAGGHGRSIAAGARRPRRRAAADNATRENLRRLLREGKLDDKMVEIDTADAPPSFVDVFSGTGMEEMVLNLRDMFPQGARRTKRRRLSVPEALEVLTDEEANEARSTSNGCRRTRSAAPSRPGSSSSTRSTRSRARMAAATAPTCRARACSATCCRSSRARRCRRSTGRSRPITCCSSRRARSTSRSPRT